MLFMKLYCTMLSLLLNSRTECIRISLLTVLFEKKQVADCSSLLQLGPVHLLTCVNIGSASCLSVV
jgi:hypothetical protein